MSSQSSDGRGRDEEEAGPSKRMRQGSEQDEQEAQQGEQGVQPEEPPNARPKRLPGQRGRLRGPCSNPRPRQQRSTPSWEVYKEEELLELSTNAINNLPMKEKVEQGDIVFKRVGRRHVPIFKGEWKVYFNGNFYKSDILQDIDRAYVQQVLPLGGAFNAHVWLNTNASAIGPDQHFQMIRHVFRMNAPRSHFIAPTLCLFRQEVIVATEGWLYTALHPPGPTLKKYKEYMTTTEQKTFTVIELCRIFDHICAACDHLHNLQPRRVVHGQPLDANILLDCYAVSLGREQAMLAGPIRLFDFREATFGSEEDYQAALNTTLQQIQDWSTSRRLEKITNPFLKEGSTFYKLTLYGCIWFNQPEGHRRGQEHSRHLRQVFTHLSKGKVMLCAQIQDYGNLALDSGYSYAHWLNRNNYTRAEFAPNQLIYNRNGPDAREDNPQGEEQQQGQAQPPVQVENPGAGFDLLLQAAEIQALRQVQVQAAPSLVAQVALAASNAPPSGSQARPVAQVALAASNAPPSGSQARPVAQVALAASNAPPSGSQARPVFPMVIQPPPNAPPSGSQARPVARVPPAALNAPPPGSQARPVFPMVIQPPPNAPLSGSQARPIVPMVFLPTPNAPPFGSQFRSVFPMAFQPPLNAPSPRSQARPVAQEITLPASDSRSGTLPTVPMMSQQAPSTSQPVAQLVGNYWEEKKDISEFLPAPIIVENLPKSKMVKHCRKMFNKFAEASYKIYDESYEARHGQFKVPLYKAKWHVLPKQEFTESDIIKPTDREFVAAQTQNGGSFDLHVWSSIREANENYAKHTHGILHNIFGIRTERSDFIVRVLWHYGLHIFGGHLNFVLYPPLGPSLSRYQDQIEKFKIIEIFRIFDHICSACNFLHELQPSRIIHQVPVEERILLDYNAASQGRDKALLAGPLRLYNFDDVKEVKEPTYNAAKESTKRRIESWNNQSLMVDAPDNVLLREGKILGGILYLAICRGFVTKRDFKYYQLANLPQSLRFLVEYLEKRHLMLCEELQAFPTFESNRPDFESWAHKNGHNIQDFTPNVLVYTGNSPKRSTF